GATVVASLATVAPAMASHHAAAGLRERTTQHVDSQRRVPDDGRDAVCEPRSPLRVPSTAVAAAHPTRGPADAGWRRPCTIRSRPEATRRAAAGAPQITCLSHPP